MISKAARIASLALSLTWAGAALAQDKPVLNVMTYSAFAGKYGPGPKFKTAFEANCGCTLTYVSTDDAAAMLARLKLEGASSAADVVAGLDLNLMAEAKATGLFAPTPVKAEIKLPVAWSDETFVPFDYGWFAFVYDSSKLAAPPASLQALVDAPNSLKIVMQDPRSSSVGLGGLLWMRSVFGDKADAAWTKLKPKIVTVTKGWSEAYGLFLKGEADMVLSYTTSPAYHMIAEKKEQFRAAPFAEGHYLQVEIAGALKSAKQPELAAKFLAFLTGPEAQAMIATTQWMYPARAGQATPPEFEKLVQPAKTLIFDSAQVQANRRGWTEQWLAATAR